MRGLFYVYSRAPVELQLAYGHVGGAIASNLGYSMTTSTDFQSYVRALQQHDWHYEFSDDHRVWKDGMVNEKRLLAQANTNALFMHAFTCWTDCMKTGNSLHHRNQRDACIERVATTLINTEQAAV